MAVSTLVPKRYWVFGLCILGLAASLAALAWHWAWVVPALAFGGLTGLGVRDLTQSRQSVRRNYPVLAHMRYLLESIGPEIRQYFIESDTEERPFSREQRSVVYQRAKNQLDKRPFGTLLDLYDDGAEWMSHSLTPSDPDPETFRITIGGNRAQPYSASVLNISAMSFGSLSPNAVTALNRGAARGNFYHDTGEGGVSRYHRDAGGDLVWEIGTGYFGCRDATGQFDPEQFAATAADPQIRMIEIKLSQGAKPGHGGILPGAKVTPEIAAARGVPVGEDVLSPAAHSAFHTPLELVDFVDRLRELAGGKPVGIKLAIGHPHEWFAIVKAMMARDRTVDFVVVDGGEGGTGAAPLELINRLGMPLDDALLLVHNTLVGCGLREHIRIGAAGKITSAFKMARTMALGADWCNSGRGFMFALGCIQSLSCHTDKCPSGVATQDPWRNRSLDPTDKAERVYQFHRNTVAALGSLLASAGLDHPQELGPRHLIRRTGGTETITYQDYYPHLRPRQLLEETVTRSPFADDWPRAQAESFKPLQEAVA